LYEDSFDYERLLVELLRPLGESGSRLYRAEIYDRRTDLLVDSEQMEGSADAILLFDGVFLLRPSWSTRGISASSSPSPPKRSSAARASATPRCTDHLMMLSGGSAPGNLPSQRHYCGTVRPAELADVVLENDDPSQPGVLVRS
jgi:uridine kinase